MSDLAETALGIYIHWPFCARKCPYCDFNSHVREGIEQARWQAAFLRALDKAAEETGGREVASVFFGGGTPSLMPPETVAAILGRIHLAWRPVAGMEVTLEANPGSVETACFQAFRAAGVNRVSIGVQSLDDAELAFLGRVHSAAEAVKAVETAAAVFERYSFDLIYALPGQSPASWAGQLRAALRLAGDHVSAYELTIEAGTAFHSLQRQGKLSMPDEDTALAFHEVTQDLLGEAGYQAYEVSNHARADAACRHNLGYWRYRDYLGIGPGAHGRVTVHGKKYATTQIKLPERWLAAAERQDGSAETRELLPPGRRAEECAMMGLRLREGLPKQRLRDEAPDAGEALLGAPSLAMLIDEGFIDDCGARLRASAKGRLLLNAVTSRWLA